MLGGFAESQSCFAGQRLRDVQLLAAALEEQIAKIRVDGFAAADVLRIQAQHCAAAFDVRAHHGRNGVLGLVDVDDAVLRRILALAIAASGGLQNAVQPG